MSFNINETVKDVKGITKYSMLITIWVLVIISIVVNTPFLLFDLIISKPLVWLWKKIMK